jgi:hypothetical protein
MEAISQIYKNQSTFHKDKITYIFKKNVSEVKVFKGCNKKISLPNPFQEYKNFLKLKHENWW